MREVLHIIDAGRMRYGEALALQRGLVEEKRAGDGREWLVLVEHEPVITVGRGGGREHILAGREALARAGVEVCEVERGGDVTYHGPGQVTGYPIVDLKRRGLGVHGYLRALEGAIIEALGGMGIAGERREGLTGVWTRVGKIASIGIAVRRWITYHGFSLNVGSDLRGFGYITPCGIEGVRMPRVEGDRGEGVDGRRVKGAVVAALSGVLGMEAVVAECAAAGERMGK